jgi:hypothetical protein
MFSKKIKKYYFQKENNVFINITNKTDSEKDIGLKLDSIISNDLFSDKE